jgi:alkanesulfonate monooxygenase SsuD/methylene tetrahydromethanopterin reductase-like flavin-dependent oxidoreductase (luciferase family)
MFRPTRAPRGRLVRLGVVLDTRNPPHRVQEIARMCDGAGIDALWVRDRLGAPDGVPRLEAWTTLALVAPRVARARVGALLAVDRHAAATLAAMAGTLDAAIGGRLELGLSPDGIDASTARDDAPDLAEAERLTAYAEAVRTILAGTGVEVPRATDGRELDVGVPPAQPGGPVLSIAAATPWQLEVAAAVADDVLLPAGSAHDVRAAVAAAWRACERAGRDPDTLGIAMEVPVSIGRTRAEAEARAEAEPLFGVIGHPAEVGVFGTLERCQERVIELAHAGVDDLRCILPNSDDVHDVIAQLTAVAIGSVEVLTPNAPRSKDPDPPEGWGGRRSRPPTGERGQR